MPISVTMILDSISPQGHRLRTFQICAHRFILAEINTHRMLSRNYRSSRAVPVAKLLEEVRTNPAMPVAWLKNKPGMQGGEPMTFHECARAIDLWRYGAVAAAYAVEEQMKIGLHKQWSNRPLEPYLMVHGVITGTDFNNFYALRRHPDAQPEFKALADAMWECEQASRPTILEPEQWHLPYADDEVTGDAIWDHLFGPKCTGAGPMEIDLLQEYLQKVSVARVARVSYKNFDGTVDIEKDLALYDQLLASKHMSPFEHQATPDTVSGQKLIFKASGEIIRLDPPTKVLFDTSGEYTLEPAWAHELQHGNLTGWIQNRKTIPNENIPG